MPYSMLQAALGALFFLVWLFIGAMMLGDRLAEIRRQRAVDAAGAGSAPGPHSPRGSGKRSRRRRPAVA